MNRCLPSIFCSLFLLSSLRGQEATVDIAQAVRDLGAATYQVRKQARASLEAVGWEAKAELEKAAKLPDPEVSDVARQLLAKILPGVTGSTSVAQRRLVEQYTKDETGDRARRLVWALLRERPFPHGLLLGLLEWEKDRSEQEVLIEMSRWSLPGLLARGHDRTYERFLGWAARLEVTSAIPQIAAYAYHRGKLAEMRQQVAASVPAKPSPFSRQLLAELHLLAGHEAEAVAVARKGDNWPLLEQMLVRTCEWAELAKELAARRKTPSDLERLQLAAVQRLAGQDKLAMVTLREVMAVDENGNGLGLAEAAGEAAAMAAGTDVLAWQGLGRRFVAGNGVAKTEKLFVSGAKEGDSQQKAPAAQCLLAFGLTGDAIQVLLNQRATDAAVDILLTKGEPRQAERLLQLAIEEAKPPEKWLLTARWAGVLRGIGDDTGVTVARETLERCRKGEKEMIDPKVTRAVVHALYRGGFKNLLVAMLPGLLARFEGDDEEIAQSLVPYLSPVGHDSRFWWGCLAKADPKQGLVARATRLRDFLNGRLSADETQAILRLGLSPEAPARERVPGLVAVARTSASLGRQAEAEKALALAMRYAVETKDAKVERVVCWASLPVFAPVLKWAKVAASLGRLGDAGEAYYLAQQACFLAWSGDREAGRKQVERAVAMTLPGDGSQLLRPLLAGSWQETPRALLLMSAGPVNPLSGALQAARETKDYALELRLAQRVWYMQACSPGSFYPGRLLMGNVDLAFAECRAMATAGELGEALARAKRVANAFPDDVDGLADTVAALDQAGAKEKADELVAHALSRQRKILDGSPNSAHCLNSLAWLCARTRRGMAEGEAYARRAVEIAPEQDAFIDTLAVLLYRQGDVAGGIELARKCVRMRPSYPHYLHQLGRWQEEQRKK